MNTLTMHVPNISCNHCVMTIKNTLLKMEGIDDVAADATTKNVTVDFILPASEQTIKAALVGINYPPEN